MEDERKEPCFLQRHGSDNLCLTVVNKHIPKMPPILLILHVYYCALAVYTRPHTYRYRRNYRSSLVGVLILLPSSAIQMFLFLKQSSINNTSHRLPGYGVSLGRTHRRLKIMKCNLTLFSNNSAHNPIHSCY